MCHNTPWDVHVPAHVACDCDEPQLKQGCAAQVSALCLHHWRFQTVVPAAVLPGLWTRCWCSDHCVKTGLINNMAAGRAPCAMNDGSDKPAINCWLRVPSILHKTWKCEASSKYCAGCPPATIKISPMHHMEPLDCLGVASGFKQLPQLAVNAFCCPA